MASASVRLERESEAHLDMYLAGDFLACVKPTRKNRARRKCRRPSKVATRTLVAKPGANTLTLGTLAGKKKLRRGSYRITLSATGATKKTVAFKIRR